MPHSVLKLEPSFSYKIWGGTRLQSIKAAPSELDPLGESWEISMHKDGPSRVAGTPLPEILDEKKLPYLVKFIDTDGVLSVQAHPDDEYAKLNENSYGKTECWIILDATESGGIFLGFKPGVKKEDFVSSVEKEEDLSEYMNYFSVKKGDFFYVPAGTIHAIGKGVTLCEIQQSSGVTYRVWDWNRVDDSGKSRELHIGKALDVLNFSSEENTKEVFKVQQNIFEKPLTKLVEHKDFIVESITMKSEESISLDVDIEKNERYWGICLLEGEVQVDDINLGAFQSALLTESKTVTLVAKDDVSLVVVK